jgi:gamma-glutamyl hercynylcysteine S-oxide synthase
VTAPATLHQLSAIQNLLLALVEGYDDSVCRSQYHPDLSPLGWHLGHCVYIETYWLQEVVGGDAAHSAPYRTLYTPEMTPRLQRGPQLPPRDALINWAADLQSDNLMRLANATLPQDHALLADDYLPLFLIQHHAQHYETMLMVLSQRALRADYPDYRARDLLVAAQDHSALRTVPAGHFRIGGAAPQAFDNELPPQHAELGEFRICSRPLSNAEYLAFMQAGGYSDAHLWSEAGWTWCRQYNAAHPEYWRRDAAGAWYGIGLNGPYELAADAPVHGINHYEASACAAWAGAHLPHEYQWEAAQRSRQLDDVGRVWEWCANSFHPYNGFSAFPYKGYSTPWFDGTHYTLRGASLHTRPELRRASFRNFYTAEKRHIFAGVRLVF